MERIMEIYVLENGANEKNLSEIFLERFNKNPKSVEDDLAHMGEFLIDDETEFFKTFLKDMGAEGTYEKEKKIIQLPNFTGHKEKAFDLMKKYLGHTGYDFEIKENIERYPNNLYFAIFDEEI